MARHTTARHHGNGRLRATVSPLVRGADFGANAGNVARCLAMRVSRSYRLRCRDEAGRNDQHQEGPNEQTVMIQTLGPICTRTDAVVHSYDE